MIQVYIVPVRWCVEQPTFYSQGLTMSAAAVDSQLLGNEEWIKWMSQEVFLARGFHLSTLLSCSKQSANVEHYAIDLHLDLEVFQGTRSQCSCSSSCIGLKIWVSVFWPIVRESIQCPSQKIWVSDPWWLSSISHRNTVRLDDRRRLNCWAADEGALPRLLILFMVICAAQLSLQRRLGNIRRPYRQFQSVSICSGVSWELPKFIYCSNPKLFWQ